MKELLINRVRWDDERTHGELRFPGEALPTIERPWIPTDPGGKPRESCVPAGLYRLVRHQRPNGDEALALINPGLAVYRFDADRPSDVGRYLILIHIANWVEQVIGCIAPGLTEAISDRGPMVTSSRIAMQRIMDYIGDDEAELEIRQQWHS